MSAIKYFNSRQNKSHSIFVRRKTIICRQFNTGEFQNFLTVLQTQVLWPYSYSRKHNVSITKTNRLMSLRELIRVDFQNHTEATSTHRRKSSMFHGADADDT